MPRTRISFETARRLAQALPGVEEGTVYRTPALKVRGKMFACIPNHRSAEAGSLALRMDFARRDALIAEDPETFYLPDHYAPHPCVLVRLSRTNPEMLRELLQTAWKFASRQRGPQRARSV